MQELFLRAVQMEEAPATVAQAAELYGEILRLRPGHAPALINLGTIRYNRREYREAETLYRRATEADPEYALAFFDLGNVLDELRRIAEATAAYERAVELVPRYADAHYNLALALERQGQRRRALRHWMQYVRLDPTGAVEHTCTRAGAKDSEWGEAADREPGWARGEGGGVGCQVFVAGFSAR